MVQVARLTTEDVVGLDVTRPKLDAIESVGVRALDSSDLSSLSGLFAEGPPTVVVDLVGSEQIGSWAIDALGPGGRLVALTTFVDRPVTIHYRDFVFREISLLGSRYATKAEVTSAANLVATGQVHPVIGQVVGPADLLSLHDRLRSGELAGRGALSWKA
jgi:D-arabinose 1-dehydrogenase-like Zn-dependent alcohol dehydrogenase